MIFLFFLFPHLIQRTGNFDRFNCFFQSVLMDGCRMDRTDIKYPVLFEGSRSLNGSKFA